MLHQSSWDVGYFTQFSVVIADTWCSCRLRKGVLSDTSDAPGCLWWLTGSLVKHHSTVEVHGGAKLLTLSPESKKEKDDETESHNPLEGHRFTDSKPPARLHLVSPPSSGAGLGTRAFAPWEMLVTYPIAGLPERFPRMKPLYSRRFCVTLGYIGI